MDVERQKFKAMEQELAIRRVHEEQIAAEKLQESQSQHHKQRADYSDKLERQRMVEQINAQRQIQEQERQKAEESLRRQEEIRKKTLEYEAELRQQTEMARAKAETEGRIRQERQNADIVRERDKNKAADMRETCWRASNWQVKPSVMVSTPLLVTERSCKIQQLLVLH